MNKLNKQQVPKIRFEGFSGSWGQRTIVSLSETTIGGGTPSTAIEEYWQGEIPWIQSSDLLIDNVLYISPTKKITEEAVDKSAARLIPKNSLAIVTRVGVGKLCFLPYEYATSQDFLSLVNLNIDHLYATYSLYRFLQEEKNKVQGTAIKGLTKADLLSQKISVSPFIEEQTQIGNFFQQLDKLIELQTRAVESAETYKKAMLQKMFPLKGEKAPRVRFEGFSGDWKKHTLSKIVDQVRSYSLSRSVETGVNTGFKYIHYGDIHLGKACYLDTDKGLSFINLDTDYVLLQRGDLVLADASEDYIGIAEPCVIDFEPQVKLVAGLHTIAIRPDQSQNPIFLYYYFKTKLFKKHCYRVGTGMKVFGITFNNLSKYEGYFPSIKEQIQIGNFFQKLDHNIESEKKKLEQYETMKRAMLQRMFV